MNFFLQQNVSSNQYRSCVHWADRFATDVMFQPANGDRPNVPNYLVIMTDGNSDNATATWIEAMRARSRGINIIAVSIVISFLIHFVSCLPCLGKRIQQFNLTQNLLRSTSLGFRM